MQRPATHRAILIRRASPLFAVALLLASEGALAAERAPGDEAAAEGGSAEPEAADDAAAEDAAAGDAAAEDDGFDDDDEPLVPVGDDDDELLPPPAADPGQEWPPRTPPPTEEELEVPESPEWERRLELGGGILFVSRPQFGDSSPKAVRYDPFVGWGINLRWDLLRWLRLHPYFMASYHDAAIPQGALVTDATTSISPDATVSETTVSTFSFGASVAPVWWLSDRGRAWISVGVGWGRIEVPEMTILEPTGHTIEVLDRSSVFVEFPISIGAAFDVIPDWLAVEYQTSVVPVTGQSGDALETYQAVDSSGQLRDIGPMMELDVSFVHQLSLALIL